jgi:N-acyl-D-aspartate/D-glutamate deacylase
MLDLILAGGTVVDGTGRPGRRGDVGIEGSRVVALGRIDQAARRTVSIDGLVVAPGFIDPHVHYDAQILWDPDLTPTSLHGVTTVVGGNCGFGIAPLGPGSPDYLVHMLAAVEGMHVDALLAGASWDWTGYDEWLDLVDRSTALNAAFFVGHSTVRRLVLGEAAATDAASDEQVHRMVQVVHAALVAGAVGLSTSLNENHLDGDGNPVPSRHAGPGELRALVRALQAHPGALVELVPPMNGPFGTADYDLLTELSLEAASPVLWNSLAVDETRPIFHESLLGASPYAAERGARVIAMTIPDIARLRLSFSNGMIIQAFPGWSKLFSLSPERRLAALADPAMRSVMREGLAACGGDGLFGRFVDFSPMRIGETRRDQGRLNGQTLGQAARDAGTDVLDCMLDLVIDEGLEVGFWPPSLGDDGASWKRRAEVWQLPDVLVGGGDAGAHLDAIDSFNYPAALVGPIRRDRGLVSLEEAVRLMTAVPARLFALRDRGTIRSGCFADLVVFDPDRIGPGPLELRNDLPAGAKRLYSEAVGLHHVLVNGSFVVADGKLTYDRPGRVLRRGAM